MSLLAQADGGVFRSLRLTFWLVQTVGTNLYVGYVFLVKWDLSP